jgi:hypothetical protein
MRRVCLSLLLFTVAAGCGRGTCPYPIDHTTDCGIQVAYDESNGPLADWVWDTERVDRNICEIAGKVEDLAGAERGTLAGIRVVWTGELISSCVTDGNLYRGCYHGPSLGWKDRWVHIATYDLEYWNASAGEYQIYTPRWAGQTSLAHEFLHDLIGDLNHKSPLWNRYRL